MLAIFAFFHLNLAYSSIDREDRDQVVRRCYWPLLGLIHSLGTPVGIEASGWTLEEIARRDPSWIKTLKELVHAGVCEFIGSGYVQLIGPLVPALMVKKNLELGHEVYGRILGIRPSLALVNEQAYSAGLVAHYLETGYRAIVMEWENPFSDHPDWDPNWRYFPQRARGTGKNQIPVVWNQTVAFQKFQRYAHGELTIEEYMEFLRSHETGGRRSFCIYGNDAEIFDYRPGRYPGEKTFREDGEWKRIERLFRFLEDEADLEWILPSEMLDRFFADENAGHLLALESPAQPVPVKKQPKYNITRWAVTGRDDLGCNTICWRIYRSLVENGGDNEAWRTLCRLWASDYRTHITESRWKSYAKTLLEAEKIFCGRKSMGSSCKPWVNRKRCRENENSGRRVAIPEVRKEGRYITVTTPHVKVRLNGDRGLAFDKLWFDKGFHNPCVGTLPHGYFQDITMAADFYSGHLIFEIPGRHKVTDLLPVTPRVSEEDGEIRLETAIPTTLGEMRKTVLVSRLRARVTVLYEMWWGKIPLGSLRIGNLTFIPESFHETSLFYRSHNGGEDPETFPLNRRPFDHGAAASFLVSASQGIGLTEGWIDLGDTQTGIRVGVPKEKNALLGMLTYKRVDPSFFLRLSLSAREIDETSRGHGSLGSLPIRFSFWCESLDGG